MRLIHCADLHLDSRLTGNLEGSLAKERRNELLNTYERMVTYAGEHGVDGILIAGDLFDTRKISATARQVVLHSMQENPGILFFYLRGNHDSDYHPCADGNKKDLPKNLMLFDEEWTSYRLGRVVIHGIELSGDTGEVTFSAGNPEDINIVMLHGQVSEYGDKKGAAVFSLRTYRNRSIDYLALGHVHSYQREALDARGIWCYPGCLEGRGYDECGEHGFVLLDIDESRGTVQDTFVPFAARRIVEVLVDVSGCISSVSMRKRSETALSSAGCRRQDMIHLILTGELDVENEVNPAYIQACLKEQYYHVKVTDHTTWHIDPEEYLEDETLKGTFVRRILGDSSLNEEERYRVIRYGLQALAGEEVTG